MGDLLCQCHPDFFAKLTQPLFRLICHCLTCQEFVKGPFNDECTFWLRDCPKLDLAQYEFKSYQRLSAIERGICKQCGKASVSQAQVGSFAHFVMIPSQYLNPDTWPEPIAHVYYHRRHADARDHSPKISGHWRSQLKLLSVIGACLFGK